MSNVVDFTAYLATRRITPLATGARSAALPMRPAAARLCERCKTNTVSAEHALERVRDLTELLITSPERRLTHRTLAEMVRSESLHLQAVISVCWECELDAWIEALRRDQDAQRAATKAQRAEEKRLAEKRARRAARKHA